VVTGCEWRIGDSDLAWEAGGFDTARFELHVLDEEVIGAPDGLPGSRRLTDTCAKVS
jgi:hypothetical protein